MFEQPSDEQFLEFVLDFRKLLESEREISHLEESENVVRALHALLAHTLHVSWAGAKLFRSGDIAASMALARVALEHAVYAQLVSQHEKGFEGLLGLVTKNNTRSVSQAKAVLSIEPELLRLYEEVVEFESVPEFQTFSKAAFSFLEGELIMLMYGNLSGFVHPSNSLFNTYLPDGHDSIELQIAPVVNNPGRVPHALAFSLALSIGAFESNLALPNNFQVLQIASRTLGLQTTLKLKSTLHG